LKTVKVILLLILAVILVGCSILYIPVASEHTTVSDNYGIIKTTEFTLAVANKLWVKEPQELTDYFMTFHITVRNKTSEKIPISPEDLSLLDEYGNQYDIVLPGQVMNLLMPEDIIFDRNFLFGEEDDQVYENWKEAKNNLITESFKFGTILPNAQKSGYLYFPKLKSQNRKCKFIYRGHQIDFVRE
jgi:hypothetical protein